MFIKELFNTALAPEEFLPSQDKAGPVIDLLLHRTDVRAKQ